MHEFLLQVRYSGDQKDRLHCINLVIDFTTSTPTQTGEMDTSTADHSGWRGKQSKAWRGESLQLISLNHLNNCSRTACHEKDQSLKDKDDAVEMLAKKVDTLTKAMESEAKKSRREIAATEKELAATRLEKEQDSRAKRFGSTSGSANSSQLPPGRSLPRSGSARNM